MTDDDASETAGEPELIDPRVKRTRERLFRSLLEQIQTKRWDKIRVQDLLDDTGVSRSAFYAHFDNKYHLLTAAMPRISVPIVSAADGPGHPDLFPLFDHVNEMAPVLRPLLSQPVFSEITDSFHRQLAASWSEYLDSTSHRNDPILAELLAGALTAAIRNYGLDRNREDPALFAARITTHFENILGPG